MVSNDSINQRSRPGVTPASSIVHVHISITPASRPAGAVGVCVWKVFGTKNENSFSACSRVAARRRGGQRKLSAFMGTHGGEGRTVAGSAPLTLASARALANFLLLLLKERKELPTAQKKDFVTISEVTTSIRMYIVSYYDVLQRPIISCPDSNATPTSPCWNLFRSADRVLGLMDNTGNSILILHGGNFSRPLCQARGAKPNRCLGQV